MLPLIWQSPISNARRQGLWVVKGGAMLTAGKTADQNTPCKHLRKLGFPITHRPLHRNHWTVFVHTQVWYSPQTDSTEKADAGSTHWKDLGSTSIQTSNTSFTVRNKHMDFSLTRGQKWSREGTVTLDLNKSCSDSNTQEKKRLPTRNTPTRGKPVPSNHSEICTSNKSRVTTRFISLS